jgi:acetyl-CoA carboxylase biotin carboxylase subunit
VLGDKHCNVVIFGERDCSLQRKNQKIMEECPAAVLTQKQRDDMIEICKAAAKKMKYSSVGTFEFMFEDGKFYFLEMNTRLQVEHPVTEMVYGVDLVREQIRVAAGEKLGYTQSNVIPHGHAIEFRINAEDPENFTPCPGQISLYAPSGGLGVRVDSAVYTGYTIPPTYDSMIAKLIVHAQSRPACIMRAERALDEFVIEGVKTTIPLQQRLLKNEDVRKLKEAYSVLGDIWFKLDVEDKIIVNGTRYRHPLLSLAMNVIRDIFETSDIKVVKGEEYEYN